MLLTTADITQEEERERLQPMSTQFNVSRQRRKEPKVAAEAGGAVECGVSHTHGCWMAGLPAVR